MQGLPRLLLATLRATRLRLESSWSVRAGTVADRERESAHAADKRKCITVLELEGCND